jgi:HD-like signal output (HDOD) protein
MEIPASSTVARLLQLMDQAPGFAGLGSSIKIISKLGEEDCNDSQQIVDTILRDAALTLKLLRIANAARHARSGRNITTIDQVLALLGLNTVKSVALSLALLDNLSHKPQSKLLHAEIVAAYFCGNLDFEITRQNAPRFNAQEAQVCGLMQNLARMMVTYFLYEELERCRMLQAEQNLGEEEAVRQIFGMSFSEMGAQITHLWNLPTMIEHSMLPAANTPQASASSEGWHQNCSAFCRHLTDVLFRMPENCEKLEIAHYIDQYTAALGLKKEKILPLISKSLSDTDAIMAAMSFPFSVEQARGLLRKSSERVQDRISSSDIMNRESERIEGKTPIEVVQQALRQMHTHCNFDLSLLCLVDNSGALRAIAGVGRNAAVATSRFRCQGPKPDLFRTLVTRRQDAFIPDLQQPSYARLLPDWYSEFVHARSVMLMPLVHGDKLLGVIYGDYAELQAHAPAEMADETMLNWRQQLLQALRVGSLKTSEN